MDVVAISIVAPCALQSVPQPAVLVPLGNLVVILPETQFKIAHRIAVSHASGSPYAFQLVDDGTLRATQSLGDSRRRNPPDQFLEKIHLAGRPSPAIHVQLECEPCGVTFDVPARQARQTNP